jgi:hypothetical protein
VEEDRLQADRRRIPVSNSFVLAKDLFGDTDSRISSGIE